ncbi:MAG: hypothetical protein KDA78_21490, partial [Planctomycetaceae bacterium]|nr:hypothetical protein [Planctomycetaceae bacterium]
NSDILGRDNSGNWYSAESNGTSLTNRVAEMWAPVNWQFVNGGDFQPKATSDEIVIPPSPTKQDAEETTTPDIAGRWSGANETTSSVSIPTTEAASLLKSADEDQESSADYDSFGDSTLLDLLFAG